MPQSKRISKETKAIADKYIQAAIDGKFDDVKIKNPAELKQALKDGKVIKALLDEIEIRYVSITSIMMNRMLLHQSAAYRNGIYKGFKILLDN
jgi:hypothetical protein